ncbi:MAG TPA: hypothetical protein VFK10_06790 [Burkholderiaceae bacterium]|nr:hypothetical protein [Burkholderiaceae bacterium]
MRAAAPPLEDADIPYALDSPAIDRLLPGVPMHYGTIPQLRGTPQEYFECARHHVDQGRGDATGDTF